MAGVERLPRQLSDLHEYRLRHPILFDWLFGYGMDTKERVRPLPFIAVANQRCRDADWATPEPAGPTRNYLA